MEIKLSPEEIAYLESCIKADLEILRNGEWEEAEDKMEIATGEQILAKLGRHHG